LEWLREDRNSKKSIHNYVARVVYEFMWNLHNSFKRDVLNEKKKNNNARRIFDCIWCCYNRIWIDYTISLTEKYE